MAVIHISEAEAARDLPGIISKVRAGEDIRIDSGPDTFTIVPVNASKNDQPRLISEMIAELERLGSTATLPEGFADAVMDGIRSHENEYLMDGIESWE